MIPNVTVVKKQDNENQGLWLRTSPKRYKRSNTPLTERPKAFHSFAPWFIPWLGVSDLGKAIGSISALIERIGNETQMQFQPYRKK